MRQVFKGDNYSREETIRGNTVFDSNWFREQKRNSISNTGASVVQPIFNTEFKIEFQTSKIYALNSTIVFKFSYACTQSTHRKVHYTSKEAANFCEMCIGLSDTKVRKLCTDTSIWKLGEKIVNSVVLCTIELYWCASSD